MEPRDVATFDEPWGVLAGLAEQASRGELLNRNLGAEALLEVLSGGYRLGCASRDLDGYIEIQVHGGISLVEDVDAIVLDPSFRGSEVERDVTMAAERFDFELVWHCGSELSVEEVSGDFRGPTMPSLAWRVAGLDGMTPAR